MKVYKVHDPNHNIIFAPYKDKNGSVWCWENSCFSSYEKARQLKRRIELWNTNPKNKYNTIGCDYWGELKPRIQALNVIT